ncbi:SDR family NAD(P)-dependent oxidoreductase [Pseudidiomarina sp. 1APP75-32.1]|uniref:SDR family NAD(P)-dependent oxidoreductase n=1 Tax=Pseudidiomarina terrestris TaxID=2820060 RepID=A0AAW7QY81_9GAMM|nr:SDR family NAD(P)-dependent oxidoreductase [Pseudidiomarina sp. 1APP75-32.1]MDN7124028.1 SDR family NAD(P)-dependent oxidoreductase [Pseudidiomarina sp. 1APP75-32.1]
MTTTSKQKPVALITGAGRRFGFELAKALLAENYLVLAHYNSSRDGVAELEQLGAIGLQADLTQQNAVELLIENVKTHTDRLDLLVNNASCFFNNEKVNQDRSALAAVFQVHVQAPYLLIHALSDLLASTGNGVVINITDIYTDSPSTDYIAYCAAKAGLANLTQSFAKQLAPEVRVNGIQPGPILFLPEHDSEHRDKVLAETPLKIEGGLDPMIQAVRFLRDNQFVTGEFIKVDGGRALVI